MTQFWVCLHIKSNSNANKFSRFTNTVLKIESIFLLIIHIFHVRKPGTVKGNGRLLSLIKSAQGALSRQHEPLSTSDCLISITADFLVLTIRSGCCITGQLWAYYRAGSSLWEAEDMLTCTWVLLMSFVMYCWCSRAGLKLLGCCRSTAFVLETLSEQLSTSPSNYHLIFLV